MGIRDDLGKDLAGAQASAGGLQTVSAKVFDVGADGTVNLTMGGADFYGVACTDAYTNRAAGDVVAVRRGAVPVVLWRLGEDPADASAATVRAIAEDAASDLQVVRSVTWGTGAPAGTGWQAGTTVHARKNPLNGKVELYVQLATSSDPSPPDPSVRPPSAVTVTATASGSWRNGSPDDYAASPVQGDWTGGGARRGAWFYGAKIAAACAGKTVKAMTVSFTRKTGSGVNGKRPLHLYLHGYQTPPSGQLTLGSGPEELLSLSVGAKGSAALPAAWRTALASGSARGLAIYTTGSADYMAVTGGTLTISFS
ncbi:hypothetical protein ABTX35_02045 [Streptomyces sp. NPDC096080]|uniref:hypothetical protein n=1 Tax=Streptomyces sp. NPDC096080 TaxID=3156693 RepID=UPI00332BB111